MILLQTAKRFFPACYSENNEATREKIIVAVMKAGKEAGCLLTVSRSEDVTKTSTDFYYMKFICQKGRVHEHNNKVISLFVID
jgi:hypothetical protein